MRLNVGDLAIITQSKFYPSLVGQICTIVGPYEPRLCAMPNGSTREMLRYRVRLLDGRTGALSFRALRPLGGDELAADAASEATFV